MEQHREWTVAYIDEHPFLNGQQMIRMGNYPTAEQAQAGADAMRHRPGSGYKRDIHVESRLVADWERED